MSMSEDIQATLWNSKTTKSSGMEKVRLEVG